LHSIVGAQQVPSPHWTAPASAQVVFAELPTRHSIPPLRANWQPLPGGQQQAEPPPPPVVVAVPVPPVPLVVLLAPPQLLQLLEH
jgi:hypothetical protein